MKITTYFLLFFALFLCNFAKAQDTIPTPPTPSPEAQKVMNRVPEIKKAIDKIAKELFIDRKCNEISFKNIKKINVNAFNKKQINVDEKIAVYAYLMQMLEKSKIMSTAEIEKSVKERGELMKERGELMKERGELMKERGELIKKTEEKIEEIHNRKTDLSGLDYTEDEKKAELSQIAKDIENKVAGAEQKYVAYVEENPELKADEKVRILYEKCKAKLKK